MIGEEGRGVPTIIEMVQHTRLDAALAPAALMRQGTVQAIHHCRGRSAFQRKLADQPLMQSVLADLALESEAATAMILRVARAFDEGAEDPEAAAFAPHCGGTRQVLAQQARRAPSGGIHGVPGRCRLCRGIGPAPALPRGAGQQHLGGFRQRHLPGHSPRLPQGTGHPARLPCKRSNKPKVSIPAWTAGWRILRTVSPSRKIWKAGHAVLPSVWPWLCKPRFSFSTRRTQWRRPFARHA